MSQTFGYRGNVFDRGGQQRRDDAILGTAAHADTEYALPSPVAKFVIKALAQGGAFQTYKVDTSSGDSWYAANGKWIKLGDDAPPGPGVYDLTMLPLPDAKTFTALRIDVSTGRAWYINGTKWSQFTDQ